MHRFNWLYRSVPAGLVIASIHLASCSTSNPAGPSENTGSAPAIGSHYTFHSITLIDYSSEFNSINEMVVTESGLKVEGEENVVKITSDSIFNTYYTFRNNGDIGFLYNVEFNGTIVDSIWVTYPTGGRSDAPALRYDRDINGKHVLVNGTIRYLGPQQLTVPAGTFRTEMVEFRAETYGGNAGATPLIESSNLDTLWFAPDIHLHVKKSGVDKLVIDGPGSTLVTYLATTTLQRYTLL
ncbi:MAG TPA: hypothetical protein VHI13_22415 [Candidatus Kapabacteria bacterium]|nr:hypothetical protein [Candidatus Kapabacteria bacterium]